LEIARAPLPGHASAGAWSILVFHGVAQPTVEDRKRTNRSTQGLRYPGTAARTWGGLSSPGCSNWRCGSSVSASPARATTNARASRRGYANGSKPRRIDTPGGHGTVQVPKSAGHEGEPFYPQSLERGRRSVRAVMLAVAEIVHQGRLHPRGRGGNAPVRHREPVVFRGEPCHQAVGRGAGGLAQLPPSGKSATSSSMPVTRRCASVAWFVMPPCFRPSVSARTRGAGCWASRCPCPRPRSTGALSLESLQARGLRGVEYVVSSDHGDLRAARRAVPGGTKWQHRAQAAQAVAHPAMPSSIWLKMPSITPRMPPSANALAPSCAPSEMPPTWPGRRPPRAILSPAVAMQPRSWPNG